MLTFDNIFKGNEGNSTVIVLTIAENPVKVREFLLDNGYSNDKIDELTKDLYSNGSINVNQAAKIVLETRKANIKDKDVVAAIMYGCGRYEWGNKNTINSILDITGDQPEKPAEKPEAKNAEEKTEESKKAEEKPAEKKIEKTVEKKAEKQKQRVQVEAPAPAAKKLGYNVGNFVRDSSNSNRVSSGDITSQIIQNVVNVPASEMPPAYQMPPMYQSQPIAQPQPITQAQLIHAGVVNIHPELSLEDRIKLLQSRVKFIGNKHDATEDNVNSLIQVLECNTKLRKEAREHGVNFDHATYTELPMPEEYEGKYEYFLMAKGGSPKNPLKFLVSKPFMVTEGKFAGTSNTAIKFI